MMVCPAVDGIPQVDHERVVGDDGGTSMSASAIAAREREFIRLCSSSASRALTRDVSIAFRDALDGRRPP